MDQYVLIHDGIEGVFANTQGPWESYFRACNLYQRCQLLFTVWCTKISHFLQDGQTFKTDTFEDNPYLMLPVIWHVILPE